MRPYHRLPKVRLGGCSSHTAVVEASVLAEVFVLQRQCSGQCLGRLSSVEWIAAGLGILLETSFDN